MLGVRGEKLVHTTISLLPIHVTQIKQFDRLFKDRYHRRSFASCNLALKQQCWLHNTDELIEEFMGQLERIVRVRCLQNKQMLCVGNGERLCVVSVWFEDLGHILNNFNKIVHFISCSFVCYM